MKPLRCGLAALMLAGGCASIPDGPSVMALPGAGKTFEQFRADDASCRGYASSEIGGRTADQAMAKSAAESAAVGTAVGAAAGALIGGHEGAGAGAGTGLLFGAAAGTGLANQSGYALQHRYDIAYTQCMYSKGNQVPVPDRRFARRGEPPGYYYAPPPPLPGG